MNLLLAPMRYPFCTPLPALVVSSKTTFGKNLQFRRSPHIATTCGKRILLALTWNSYQEVLLGPVFACPEVKFQNFSFLRGRNRFQKGWALFESPHLSVWGELCPSPISDQSKSVKKFWLNERAGKNRTRNCESLVLPYVRENRRLL